MACPHCGDHCTCSLAGDLPSGRTTVLIDPDDLTHENAPVTMAQSGDSPYPGIATNISASIAVGQSAPEFYRPLDSAWRNEVSSRVRAHRRRRGFDPEDSLNLGFEPAEQPAPSATRNLSSVIRARFTEGASAPDTHGTDDLPVHTRDLNPAPENTGGFEQGLASALPPPKPSRYERIAMKRKQAQMESGVLIEFPRPQTYDMFPEDTELAEPLPLVPRILEAPEELEETSAEFAAACEAELLRSQTAYASIELDTPHQVAEALNGNVDEFELPLQVAPFSPRTVSALIDAGLVFTASAIFAVIVLTLVKFVPEGRAAMAAGLTVPIVFWAGYQYLFLVYAGITPGMQMAQLELTDFSGCIPTRRTRAARAAALLLSCLSLGLGFIWTLFDDDSLGWHDRITRTYLRES
jgi:uncharacterized RDD family membrane protein YckC